MIIIQYFYEWFMMLIVFRDVCVRALEGTHDAIEFQDTFFYKEF